MGNEEKDLSKEGGDHANSIFQEGLCLGCKGVNDQKDKNLRYCVACTKELNKGWGSTTKIDSLLEAIEEKQSKEQSKEINEIVHSLEDEEREGS